MKKIISFVLAFTMIFSLCSVAFAQDEKATLQFNDDGKFTILHLCDCQDGYPAHEEMFEYIYLMLEKYNPDLVVLGGDNTVGAFETKEAAVEELCKPFVDTKTYFTLVFGNHDYQQGWNNTELFALYEKFGGEYFLGTDEIDSQNNADKVTNGNYKAGTHFLPVYSSADADKAAFGLYMFDSGSYVFDENGEELGYNSVEPYQIDWYKETRDAYKTEDGYLPSLAFQHIVVGDVMDYLYYPSAVNLGDLGASFYGKNYTYIPKTQNFTGFLSEHPCPGYYNYGQLDAMAEKGDMLAVFSGHDHTNSYDVEIKGVHVINTPGITYLSYSDELNHGSRIIVLDEKTSSFESEIVTVNELAIENEDYAKAIGKNAASAKFYEAIGDMLQSIAKALSVFGTLLDMFVK